MSVLYENKTDFFFPFVQRLIMTLPFKLGEQ